MPRTIDATLAAALASGAGRPIITTYVGTMAGAVSLSRTPTRYKLTATALEVELPINPANAYPAVWLSRGVEIGGVQYTETTGRFRVSRIEYGDGTMTLFAELFPTTYYSAAGYDTYQNVITAFCTARGKTAVFRNPAAPWLAYKFLPAGKSIILNHAGNFLNLLRQKYLIFAADNGAEEVLFYSAGELMGAADHTYAPTADAAKSYSYHSARLYMWKDELQAVHTQGTAGDPIHNLGYLESTAAAPALQEITWGSRLVIRPDLAILDGDVFDVNWGGLIISNYALVTEEYTAPGKSHAHPRWFTAIDHNPVFGNTEGGALPSTIERVSNYTPLNTSTFNGVLSGTSNNLQAAMEKLDEHMNLLPFGVYGGVSPFTATQEPYAASVDRPITLQQWTQGMYVVAPNDATRYWQLQLVNQATGAILAEIHSHDGAANTNISLSTTTFTANIDATGVAVTLRATKVGAAGNLYLFGPALKIAS